MFFSQDEKVAHIWCADADNPLFLAKAEDFPDTWPNLQVGSVVDLKPSANSAQQTAHHLHIVDGSAE